MENVPAVKDYIKEEYTAEDLGLSGNFVLRTRDGASGKYNAKYFGAPTNRERYLCGDFPRPVETKTDNNVTTLRQILDSLGDPLRKDHTLITDINYPDLKIDVQQVTDQHYIYELAEFEYETARRLKQDKGYMGKMAFPENLNKPARAVMATMTASAREAMILGYGKNKYRLPTVREAACMMSFPIDYWFYGASKGVKHTLVGNAVPPKLSYAVAVAIANAEGEPIPPNYIPIQHPDNEQLPFIDLNGKEFELSKEKPKRKTAKFKYHIPYLIINAYRVELTNYQSLFENNNCIWDVEVRYSQGKDKAQVYTPNITLKSIPTIYREKINDYIEKTKKISPSSMNTFQDIFCMTTNERSQQKYYGPYELLGSVKDFIETTFSKEEQRVIVRFGQEPNALPLAIATGYIILKRLY